MFPLKKFPVNEEFKIVPNKWTEIDKFWPRIDQVDVLEGKSAEFFYLMASETSVMDQIGVDQGYFDKIKIANDQSVKLSFKV